MFELLCSFLRLLQITPVKNQRHALWNNESETRNRNVTPPPSILWHCLCKSSVGVSMKFVGETSVFLKHSAEATPRVQRFRLWSFLMHNLCCSTLCTQPCSCSHIHIFKHQVITNHLSLFHNARDWEQQSTQKSYFREIFSLFQKLFFCFLL